MSNYSRPPSSILSHLSLFSTSIIIFSLSPLPALASAASFFPSFLYLCNRFSAVFIFVLDFATLTLYECFL